MRPIDDYKASLVNFAVTQNEGVTIVYDPNCSSAKIFKQCVLPFVSIASVTAFLRVSLALWKVGSTLLHLMWSVYFDDFLCLARSSASKHVEFCVDALFSRLGWKISKNKLLEFNTLCKVKC